MIGSSGPRAQGRRFVSFLACSTTALALSFTAAKEARADVRFAGEWPESPHVSISVTDATRAEALRALASEAKWNLVFRGALPPERVTVVLEDASADDVLKALLTDGRYVAERQGSIITIAEERPAPPSDAGNKAPGTDVAVAAPPAPPAPPGPPELPPPPEPPPARKPRDLQILGNNIRIAKDEVVRDVTMMGGSIEIEGRVTGDLTMYGGNAHLHPSGRIEGDAHLTGGSMSIEPGGSIEGDLEVLGGEIQGADRAKIGGSVTLDPSQGASKASVITRAGRAVSESIRLGAFLFLLGVMFIALGGNRAEDLRAAIASKPMRSVALGVVGVLGALAALVLCAITIIGIPLAVVGVVGAIALGFVGATSSLTVLGAMVFGHKSKNVYVHLAVGCALFMLLGLIPIGGKFAQTLIVLAGIGGVVTTRGLGLLRRKPKHVSSGPYRTI